MTSGELSPWAASAPGPTPPPYAGNSGSYAGPWMGAPAPPGVSDEQLRRLPPPLVAAPPWTTARPTGDQRPAVIGLSVTLSVTGALLFLAGLSLLWMVALAGTQAISPVGDESYVFHTLDEIVLRLADGLWVPLYGFPVASVLTGFCLLSRRPWARIAHSAVGAAALGWAAWWLSSSLLVWVVAAVYVGTAVAVLWVRSVGRWYATRPRPVLPRGVELRG